jgi:6-phosphogluconolactonase (cycloisomerase 2 family)
MKFNKLSQLFLVSITGLVVATLLSSCAIVTIDYVFVADSGGSGSGGTGQIQTYDADSETGALRLGQSNVPSGGNNPVAMATTADYANLYVVNKASNNVVHFAISGSGVLTQKDVVTTSASPVAVAVSPAGTYLFVVSGPSPSVLTVYSLSSGAIGSVVATETLALYGKYASDSGDTIVPSGVFALGNGNAVFVSAYDQSAYNPGGTTTSTANPGWVFGYTVGSGGALTPAASPYEAGVKPSALVADPTSRFVYVTDFASNEVIGYTVQSGSDLVFLINGPFKTGNEPNAATIDPRGKYMYITNALDSTVSAFTIDLTTGTPSAAVNTTGSQTNATETTPVSVIVDPAIGTFVYTANLVGSSVSGFTLNPNTGALQPTQSTPYPTGDAPVALAAVPHGNHSIQSTSP